MSGAPAAVLLLATIVVVSLLGLYRTPALIERNLLRPHGLVQRREYATLVTSGFVHADIAHLVFNGFTFWAFGFGLERNIGTNQRDRRRPFVKDLGEHLHVGATSEDRLGREHLLEDDAESPDVAGPGGGVCGRAVRCGGGVLL